MGSIETDENNANLPVIDLECFARDSSIEERTKVGKQLVEACQQIGFVYIKNHGLPDDQRQKAFDMTQKFFGLDMEKKMLAPHPTGQAGRERHRGYCWPGMEKGGNGMAESDQDERIKEYRSVEDNHENYEMGAMEDTKQPNIWPADGVMPEFQPFFADFYWACYEPSKKILRALALGLGLAEQTFVELHTGTNNHLRILHYPPIPASNVETGKNAMFTAHCDWSSITILFQDDCGGLQVEDPNRENEFIDITPIPGTLVMNIGEMMLRWSNGVLKSTQHRVVLPPVDTQPTEGEKMTQHRYSIPYFLLPEFDQPIQPLNADADHPPKFETTTLMEYATQRMKVSYADQ